MRTCGVGEETEAAPALLLVVDHKFKVDPNGRFYSDGKVKASAFDRYFGPFSRVFVFCRAESAGMDAVKRLDLASREGVTFIPIRGASWFAIIVKYGVFNVCRLLGALRYAQAVVVRAPSLVSILFFGFISTRKAPLVVELVGDPYEALYQALGRRKVGRLLGWVTSSATKALINRAVGVHYVTDSYLQSRYPFNGLAVAASNVEVDAVDEDVLKKKLHEISRWDFGRSFKIGVIGSYFNAYKGIDTLIEALAIVRKEFPGAYMSVVGGGDSAILEPTIRNAGATSWVVLEGVLTSEAIGGWLETVDIYCQPSRTEGLPRALVEAMSRGCPAIGTTVGGIPELLRDDVLCEPGSASELAGLISAFLSDKKLAQEEAKRNFFFAKRFYGEALAERRASFWGAIAGKYLK